MIFKGKTNQKAPFHLVLVILCIQFLW